MNKKIKNNLNIKRIGIIRTDRLGDMVLTLPMVKALKQSFPNSKIIIIANSYVKPLLFNQPLIDEFYFVDKLNIKLKEFLLNLNLDAIFFPRLKFDEVWTAYQAKVPLRIGSGYRWYSFLLNKKVYEHRKVGKKNECEYNLNLISFLTNEIYNCELIRPIITAETLENLKNKIPFDFNKKVVIIHPGGGDSAPKWSNQKYRQLAVKITIETEYQVIITGVESEKDLCDYVANGEQSILNLSGKINLEEMITLINLSEGIITNSTGVLHIAASLDKKIIGFYPNSPNIGPKRWGPMNQQNIILTPANDSKEKDNLDLISLDNAFQAFKELFQ